MRGGRLRLVACLLALAGSGALPAPAAAEPLEISGGSGGPISVVVRDAPIAEVFEMLSRKEQVNILLGKDVKGNISVNLFEVSVDRAIRSIADASGYLAERRRGTYVIIERGEAGKDAANGSTIIRAFKIEYSDPNAVSEIVQKHLSRYGDVTVLGPRGLLIVEDLPEFVERISRLLAEIDRDPKLTMIEAKILEVTLDDSEDMGIDWRATFDAGSGGGTIGVRDFVLPTSGLFFDLMTSDIEVKISALAEEGRVRTLSTPTLLALEHEEAEVVIGDRLGFRVTTTINEVTTESVEFLESGVILKFTASVDRFGRIVLDVHPEVSTGVISDGLPQQTTTEVTTKLVVEDGQRVFIAGLIKDRETREETGVPYLMKIPLLGWLFKTRVLVNVNTETVVILTAHVVGEGTQDLLEERIEHVSESEDYLLRKRRRMERLPGPAAYGE